MHRGRLAHRVRADEIGADLPCQPRAPLQNPAKLVEQSVKLLQTMRDFRKECVGVLREAALLATGRDVRIC